MHERRKERVIPLLLLAALFAAACGSSGGPADPDPVDPPPPVNPPPPPDPDPPDDPEPPCEALTWQPTAFESVQNLPFFPSASQPLGSEGLLRIINRSSEDGAVSITAYDDEGQAHGPVTLTLCADRVTHLTSADLEDGNVAEGLPDGVGAGSGDWRLKLTGALNYQALPYARTGDGYVAPIQATAPWGSGGHRIAMFNPGSSTDPQSRLRLVNASDVEAEVTITGTDDDGGPGAEAVSLKIPAGAARTYTAAELEAGNSADLTGALGDGEGRWQLEVASDQNIEAMSLLSASAGYLANLSAAPVDGVDDLSVLQLPWLPAVADADGLKGLARIINRSAYAARLRITAFDDTGSSYGPVILLLPPGETRHFTSNDLETGNAGIGLEGSTGPGSGDWRLELRGASGIEAMVFAEASGGFLTPVHNVAARAGDTHSLATFYPADNSEQRSRLRLIRQGEPGATATITGTDDAGAESAGSVTAELAANAAVTLTAQELEQGSGAIEGSLGNGEGSWRLSVQSERSVSVLNLLLNPTGHLINLSGLPGRGPSTSFDFNDGAQGFVAGFADYYPAQENDYELVSDHRRLPSPLDDRSGLYLSGSNRSDDLFMYYKGQVGGLTPGERYSATVFAEIATDVPSGCAGVGGAPGESVWVKAAVTDTEPMSVQRGDLLRINIDVGNQSRGGENGVVLGNVANSRSCESSRLWELKSFSGKAIPAPVTASDEGQAWLLFGADSGFESTTSIYFTRVSVLFTRL